MLFCVHAKSVETSKSTHRRAKVAIDAKFRRTGVLLALRNFAIRANQLLSCSCVTVPPLLNQNKMDTQSSLKPLMSTGIRQ